MIIKAKYTGNTNWINLTFDDGSQSQVSIEDGIRRRYTDEYQEYISNGGIVESEFTDAELLQQSKVVKLKQIEEDFKDSESAVVSYLGFDFYGGIDSARAIDEYVRLNRLAGIDVHVVWDSSKADHVMTDAEVDGLILTIGAVASTNKFLKKNRKASLNKAITIAEVELI